MTPSLEIESGPHFWEVSALTTTPPLLVTATKILTQIAKDNKTISLHYPHVKSNIPEGSTKGLKFLPYITVQTETSKNVSPNFQSFKKNNLSLRRAKGIYGMTL